MSIPALSASFPPPGQPVAGGSNPSAASGEPLDRVELTSDPSRTRADLPAPRMAEMLARSNRPYYDEGADRKAQSRFYGSLASEAGRLAPDQLFRRLNELVESTHETRAYDPEKYLYTWVDLRPNLRLRSIYDPNPVPDDAPVRGGPEDFVIKVKVPNTSQSNQARRGRGNRRAGRKEFRTERRSIQEQANQWARALSQAPTNAVELAQRIAEIEIKSVFNCEHGVPQIWFDRSQPMRGDLHHLFTADQTTNSERSSRRFFDFPDYDGRDGKGSAPFHDERYEPAAGRGPLARATLYFLVRYPGKIGGQQGEIRPEDIDTLLRWNREDPPGLYERHRNQAIQEVQGNRNPFIDHPEWADRVDFRLGVRKESPFRRTEGPGFRQKSRKNRGRNQPHEFRSQEPWRQERRNQFHNQHPRRRHRR